MKLLAKGRFVVKGSTQIEGFNYHETFALMAKLIMGCCLLLVVAICYWPFVSNGCEQDLPPW